MPNHIETLLTSIGIPSEDITKITSLKEEDDFDATPYADKVKTNYQTQLQNDPAFFNDITLDKLPPEIKKNIETSQYARAANITVDKFLKGIGMSKEDFNDLPDETKNKLELFIPAISEKYAKTKSGDKETQAQLIEARRKIEEFDGYEEKVKTKYETESNQKITSAIFNAVLIGELSSIEGLKIPASDIAQKANEILQSKYAFEKVGDFGIELRQKVNPQMKVLKDNTSHELSLKEALSDIAKERNWINEKKDEGSGSGTFKVIPTNGQLSMIAPHVLDKISKKIAAEK